MLSKNDIIECMDFIQKKLSLSSLPSLKTQRLNQLATLNQTFYDLTISLSMELPVFTYTPTMNYNTFNFSDDIGKIMYAILNKNTKLLLNILHKQDIAIQKWFSLILNKYFLKKFNEGALLSNIDEYYKISDLLPYIELPDVLENSNAFTIQSIKREIINEITYPFYLYRIPKNTSYKQVNYLIKRIDGSVVSNITSGKVRQTIMSNVPTNEFGLIGVQLKEKGYSRKYKFMPVYYSSDYKAVLNLYKSKDYVELNNELDTLKLDYPLFKVSPITINNEDELIHLFKKAKYNKKYVMVSNKGVELFKLNVIYDYAKIIDYIYNDNYEAIGLIVNYKDKNYKLYFNVMNTNYVDGIKGKYVKISVNEYKGIILNVFYNSEVKQWSKHFNECQLCRNVKSKHYKNGICNSCFHKLGKFVNNLSGEYKESCNVEFDKIYVEDYEVFADGKFIYFNPIYGSQLRLPLFELDNFCNTK